jgi:hypothetical protein
MATNHYIFLIDKKTPFDEQVSQAFTDSINMFSKSSCIGGNNNHTNNKTKRMLSIVSIKSNGKASIVINEKITKTNALSLKIIKKTKSDKSSNYNNSNANKNDELNLVKALKLTSRLAVKAKDHIPVLIVFLFRQISSSHKVINTLNHMEHTFSNILLYSSISVTSNDNNVDSNGGRAVPEIQLNGLFRSRRFLETPFSIRTCFKQLISDYFVPTISLKLDFGTVIAYHALANIKNGGAVDHTAGNILWSDLKILEAQYARLGTSMSQQQQQNDNGMLCLKTLKLVCNSSISPEVIEHYPFIIVPYSYSENYTFVERNTNRISMILETLKRQDRSFILQYTSIKQSMITDSGKNIHKGNSKRKNDDDKRNVYYFILSPASNDNNVYYLYPVVNPENIVPLKQISRGRSYDINDSIAKKECDHYLLSLTNIGQFNPFEHFR